MRIANGQWWKFCVVWVVFWVKGMGGCYGANALEELGLWTMRSPAYGQLDDGVSAKGTYVMVGHGGTILVSTDFQQWRPVRFDFRQTFRGVAFGAGRFVAVSQFRLSGSSFPKGGSIFVSEDGLEWVELAGVSHPFERVRFFDGQFLAVAQDGVIMRSADGLNWESTVPEQAMGLYALTHGGGVYMVGGGGPAEGYIAVSVDGEHWVRRAIPGAGRVTGLAYGAGRFVAVRFRDRRICSSVDGINWETVTIMGDGLYDVSFGDGKFAAVGHSNVFVSQDGLRWDEQFRTTPQARYLVFDRAIFLRDRFLALGARPDWNLVSEDGLKWSGWPEGMSWMSTFYGGAASSNLVVVAGAFGGLMSSADGIEWRRHGVTHSEQIYLAVAKGGNGWVAVGMTGLSTNRQCLASWSADGIQWKEAEPFSRGVLYGTTYGQSNYVAVGDDRASGTGLIFRSADGLHWEGGPFEGIGFSGVAFGNGRFVGVGSGIAVSSDGASWMALTNIGGGSFECVLFTGNKFLVGGESRIGSSWDGVSWSFHRINVDCLIMGLAYARGFWVATAMTLEGVQVMTSRDGVKWAIQRPPLSMVGPVFFGDSFLVVGDWIVQSKPVARSIRFRDTVYDPGGRVRFYVEAIPGQGFELERSTNLVEWGGWRTITPEEDLIEVTDEFGNGGMHFYRARLR